MKRENHRETAVTEWLPHSREWENRFIHAYYVLRIHSFWMIMHCSHSHLILNDSRAIKWNNQAINSAITSYFSSILPDSSSFSLSWQYLTVSPITRMPIVFILHTLSLSLSFSAFSRSTILSSSTGLQTMFVWMCNPRTQFGEGCPQRKRDHGEWRECRERESARQTNFHVQSPPVKLKLFLSVLLFPSNSSLLLLSLSLFTVPLLFPCWSTLLLHFILRSSFTYSVPVNTVSLTYRNLL